MDQCRILDPHSMFLIGVLVASYMANDIYIQDAPEEKSAPAGENEKAAELPSNHQQSTALIEQHVPVIEDHPMQQIDEGLGGNEEQMAAQSNEHIVGEEQRFELPPAENQEAEQIEAQQCVTASAGTCGENADAVGVPEGVDPAFLAALPEEMRQEVIRDHLIQQQMNAATNTQVFPYVFYFIYYNIIIQYYHIKIKNISHIKSKNKRFLSPFIALRRQKTIYTLNNNFP